MSDTLLTRWRAEREAARGGALAGAIVNAGGNVYPTSAGTKGSELYEWMVGAQTSTAGPAVTERTAMCVSAVYGCIGLLAGALTTLPLHTYIRTEDGRQRNDHDLWWLFNEQPSPICSAATYWEYLMWSLLLHGDAFARIERASPLSPKIIGFHMLHPWAEVSSVERHDGRLLYVISQDGKTQALDQDDMLHVPGLGFDGRRGFSPLRYAARQQIGTALAADEYGARFFSNGGRPDYVVTVEGKMNEEQAKIFRESWMARYAGVHNAHIPAILSGQGADVKALSLSPEDAQLIQTRSWQALDIARIYGVPPHMIGLQDKSSSWGTGIEQLSLGFIKYTLNRHLVKFEQEMNRKCFRTVRNFAQFDTTALERGDIKTRYEAARVALGRAGERGWMTANEVRAGEFQAPIAGGDTLSDGSKPGAADPDAGSEKTEGKEQPGEPKE